MPRWRTAPRHDSPSRSPAPSLRIDGGSTGKPHSQNKDTALEIDQTLWPSLTPAAAQATPWLEGQNGLSPPPRGRRASSRSLGAQAGQSTPQENSTGPHLRRVRSATTDSSSATTSSASFEPHETKDGTPETQKSDPRTFGGASEEDVRLGRGRAVSVAETDLSSSAEGSSVVPRSLTTEGGAGRMSRDWIEWSGRSPVLASPRSAPAMGRQSTSLSPLSPSRTFDERSWEFKVAEALFVSAPSRTPSSTTVSPTTPSNDSPTRSIAARLPLRRGSLPLLSALLTPPRLRPVPSSPRQLRPYKSSPEILRPVTPSSQGESDEDTWHDAEEGGVEPEAEDSLTRGLSIRPSSRAAVEWATPAGVGGKRISGMSVHDLVSTSPPLSPASILDLQPLRQGSSSSLSLEVFLEEEDVVIPFPTRPTSYRTPTDANFYSSPPRELRKSWMREQRDSQRSSRTLGPHLHDGPDLTFARRASSAESSVHSHRLGPLALVPPGAWLFAAGFLLPLCWWIGAFYPRLPSTPKPTSTPQLEKVTVEGGGDTDGATVFERRRWSEAGKQGRWSLLLEGAGVGKGQLGPLQLEGTVWVWRRRNRIMSLLSVVMLCVIVGVGIWAGLG